GFYQIFVLLLRYNSFAFPSLQIDVNLSQPERVSLGSAPVHVGEKTSSTEKIVELLAVRIALHSLKRHETVSSKPCIGVEFLPSLISFSSIFSRQSMFRNRS